jgi:glycosyltransferase involved in cell wall biosynthesis
VNGWLNKAHVGLCLSVEEGANYASMEYLLAGLPVVSTRSRGGRDRYFHRDDCIVCDPDARQIAEAVQALKSRHVPAVEIRNRVLTQVDHERAQYKERVESLIREWWPDQSAPIDVSKIKLIPRERSLADLDAELTRLLEERVERALHTA